MLILAMIFLKDNGLLERQLNFDDIKPRLLGHWGTCPGLTMVYAHLNRLIRDTGLDALLVVGPGEKLRFIRNSIVLIYAMRRTRSTSYSLLPVA
jgi:phosphoketolase